MKFSFPRPARLWSLGVAALSLVSCTATRPAAEENHPLTATYLSQPLQLDGRLTEAAWAQTPSYNLCRPARESFPLPPKAQAQVKTFEPGVIKLLYDAENLYLGGVLQDSDLIQKKSGKQLHFYMFGDTIEFFIKAGGKFAYGEFYLAPDNSTTTFFFDFRHFRNDKRSFWRPEFRTATQISGTLNQFKTRDKFWSFEAAIPRKLLAEFLQQDINSPGGWEILIGRYNYNTDQARTQLSSYPPLPVDDFSHVSYYGKIQLQLGNALPQRRK